MQCLTSLTADSFLLKLHVQPRAKVNGLAGFHGDALKLRLNTPPVDGKANKAVEAYLGKLFGVPKSSVNLKSGHQSRSKQVKIEGLGVKEAEEILRKALDS